jgi:hypothetical protein
MTDFSLNFPFFGAKIAVLFDSWGDGIVWIWYEGVDRGDAHLTSPQCALSSATTSLQAVVTTHKHKLCARF